MDIWLLFSFCSWKSYCKDQLCLEVQLSGRTGQACEALGLIPSTTKKKTNLKRIYVDIDTQFHIFGIITLELDLFLSFFKVIVGSVVVMEDSK